MRVLILAAGYGTRLSSLTKRLPKALLPIDSIPLLSYLVRKIQRLAETTPIDEIVLVTNQRYFSQFQEWKKQEGYDMIRVLNDGSTSVEDRRGAIGDVHFSIAGQADDWLVLGSDNFFDWELTDFVSFFNDNKSFPVVGLYDIKDTAQAAHMGVVQLDGAGVIVDFQEKPENPRGTLVATCIYAFPGASISLLDEYVNSGNHSDMLGMYIRWLAEKVPVCGYRFEGYWKDIGTEESYRAVAKKIKKG